MDVLAPRWADLEEVVQSATRQLLVCSPYFTLAGLDRVLDGFHGERLDFWTRLSPSDWVNGVSEPDDLLAMLELLAERSAVELRIGQRLHAKAYVADDGLVLLGSANLTTGGFASNVELMVRVADALAPTAADVVRRTCQPVKVVTLQALRAWVTDSAPAIHVAARERHDDKLPEVLAPVQHSLDEMLGLGQSSLTLPALERGDLDSFIAWLPANRGLPGARVILARATNADGSNLTGHVKQSFFALMRFLAERPAWIEPLRGALTTMTADDLYPAADPGLLADWVAHLDDHATDSGDSWSYAVLRGILPPAYGGTREGGGGGISTLKRMFPLVADYAATR